MADTVGGGELSEGELEEGEVLSSEEEGGDGDKEGVRDGGEGDKNVGDVCLVGNGENSEDVTGAKRPTLDGDSPNSKVDKHSPSGQTLPAAEAGGVSDTEEGEIFSDDEEAAYFPQRIKSRSATGPAGGQEGEGDANGSETTDEKKMTRRRRFSNSPERDSYRSRRQRSRERERDSEPKSLATLFFEDREGSQSELSDDGREGRGKRRGDRFRHSNSPASRSTRERDRDRTPRDRDKRERDYYRGKDSHRSRERDWDRDLDSNVDSSEEESSWSHRGPRSSGSKGYQPYQRGGRRGTGNYHSKHGQKHDRFGAVGSGSRGRQNSNWSPSSGQMNTGMTAHEFHSLADRVKKRREKGLSLLPTPKMKASDNLDQFNYPAPPSWYLEAVEKWQKANIPMESERPGEQNGQVPPTMSAPPLQPPSTGLPPTTKPPPLFPPSTQFTLAVEPPKCSSVGGTLPTLQPGQVPSVNAPQLLSLFPGGSAPIPPHPAVLPPMASLPVVPPPPDGTSGQPSLAVIGVGPGGGSSTTVSSVRVSSLALGVSSVQGDGEGATEDDEDVGGMKIALETPTPQSVPPAQAKTFALFQTPSNTDSEKDEGAIKEDAPNLTKVDIEKMAKDATSMSEGTCDEAMEVDTQSQDAKKEIILGTQPEVAPTTALPHTTSTPELASTNTSSTAPATSSITADLVTYSPPPILPDTPSPITRRATTGDKDGVSEEEKEEEENEHLESDPEEEDSDYDKYLDQLDEEEDDEVVLGPSLVGAISASLLQNNPLDEDFPAINPAKKPRSSKDVTLKSLLGENLGVGGCDNRRGSSTKTRGPKSIRRKIKEAEWWERLSTGSKDMNSKTANNITPTPKTPCKFYFNGFCKQGDECSFSHDGPRPKKKERCKFYLQGSCTKGDDCLYVHGEFPCKFFHTATGCKNGDNCKFSHKGLTEETREMLAQVLEPSRNLAKKAELAALGIIPPPTSIVSPLMSPHEKPKFHPGVDLQVRGLYFLAGNEAWEPPPQASPLLISIPKQVLDKALVVSIPRQKLGPPFGTVPIPTTAAPPNQVPVIPTSHPPPSVPPKANLSPFSPQSSQTSTFRLPVQPPNSALPTPPVQSAPPGNFSVPPRNFPPLPRPDQPQINFPPRPGGWPVHTGPAQPVPLFPPGGPQQIPVPPNSSQVPPGQSPLPPMPPQYPLPPSERKALLPTPPSHLRLDPKNIQWPEDEKPPEYWEAPDLTRQSGRFPATNAPPPPTVPVQFGSGGLPPSHLPAGCVPPPSGSFGPPPHVPPPAIDGTTVPPSFNSPRPQQGIVTGMDPRQNRMESKVGNNVDPRSGSGPANLPGGQPMQGGGAPGSSTQPPSGPYQPPLGAPVQPPIHTQGFQMPPNQQQWPPHPRPNMPQQPLVAPTHPPFSNPHVHNPTLASSGGMGPGLPPQAQSGSTHFGSGINPPPFQRPPMLPSQTLGDKAAVWDPGNHNPAMVFTGQGTSGHPMGQSDSIMTGNEAPPRPLRVDPRTKYSHFKIKPKGSTSSSSSPPVSKARESDQGSGGERAHMPKLLQEPPSLQRPFDPRELFDSKEAAASDSEVSTGHFGSTFGSFFTRLSSTEASGSGTASSNLPYGEITMTTHVHRDTEADSKSSKADTTTTASECQKDQAQDEDGKTDSTTKATVPSYLAELGVGLGDSDLTIDSAFSSLDKKEEAETSKESLPVTAKKLPSIFSLEPGTL